MADIPAWKKAGFTSQAAYEAEVARKKAAGIALTNPEIYKEYQAQTQTPAMPTSSSGSKSSSTSSGGKSSLPDYKQQGFASPEEYAAEIKRKLAAGEAFSNQAAADAFMKANPSLFGGTTPTTPGLPQTPPMPGYSYGPSYGSPGYSYGPGYGSPGYGTVPGGAAPGVSDLKAEFSPEIKAILDKIKDYISDNPVTIDNVMGSDAYRQMSGAIDTQTELAQRGGRADLAARGVLGEGSTPAAEKYAQIAGEQAQMQAGLIPQLMSTAVNQYQTGLGNLFNQLSAQAGQEGVAFDRVLSAFNALAPYQYLTEYQRNILPIDWTSVIGQVPGSYPGMPASGGQQNTGLVPARDYVTAKGGTIGYSTIGGKDVVYINGKAIDVEAVGGKVVNGRAQLPQWVVDQALGVS